MKHQLISRTILISVIFIFSLFIGAYAAYASYTSELRPVSDGAYTQWSPIGGTGMDHFSVVDESTCNGNTDYVRETTLNERDSYGVNLSSIPNGARITQISITPCASNNTSGGSSNMSVFYRLNGVNSSDSSNITLSGTTPVVLSAKNYSGLNITKSTSTNLQIGAVYKTGSWGVRLSKISTVITYDATPLAPTNLTASIAVSVPTSTVSLAWTDNASTETGFYIERSTDAVTYTQIGSVGANVTTYSDRVYVWEPGTYYYRVRAYNTYGNSAYSNVASVVNP